jgi:hypothetical protein
MWYTHTHTNGQNRPIRCSLLIVEYKEHLKMVPGSRIDRNLCRPDSLCLPLQWLVNIMQLLSSFLLADMFRHHGPHYLSQVSSPLLFFFCGLSHYKSAVLIFQSPLSSESPACSLLSSIAFLMYVSQATARSPLLYTCKILYAAYWKPLPSVVNGYNYFWLAYFGIIEFLRPIYEHFS